MNELTLLEWRDRMLSLCDTARFFTDMNVLDLKFPNGAKWEVYVAMSDSERSRGLARINMDHLDADGMLFYFPTPTWVPFTAAEMLFDLHIAWYDENRQMIKQTTVAAGDKCPICSPQAFTWVLESPHPIPALALGPDSES